MQCREEIKFMSNRKIYGVMYFILIFNKMTFTWKATMICSNRMVKLILLFIFRMDCGLWIVVA